jgi:hypothetical protein
MKAISLHQPWASAVAFGVKRVETRSWGTNFRWPIAIHAARRKSADQRYLFGQFLGLHSFQEAFEKHMAFDYDDFDQLDFGSVVAVCELVDCIRISEDLSSPCLDPRVAMTDTEFALGNYAPGRFAWLLSNPQCIEPPVPFVGRQRFFNISATLLLKP